MSFSFFFEKFKSLYSEYEIIEKEYSEKIKAEKQYNHAVDACLTFAKSKSNRAEAENKKALIKIMNTMINEIPDAEFRPVKEDCMQKYSIYDFSENHFPNGVKFMVNPLQLLNLQKLDAKLDEIENERAGEVLQECNCQCE